MKYFKYEEFDCSCGQCDAKGESMDVHLLNRLDAVRERMGRPMLVTSGMRCPAHNRAEGGSETSSHLTGLAADIAVPSSRYRYDLLMTAIGAGFTRIGIGKTFIHLDVDESKPEEVVWVYK